MFTLTSPEVVDSLHPRILADSHQLQIVGIASLALQLVWARHASVGNFFNGRHIRLVGISWLQNGAESCKLLVVPGKTYNMK